MGYHPKLFEEGYKFVFRFDDLNYNIDDTYIENEEFNWRRFRGDISNLVKYIFISNSVIR